MATWRAALAMGMCAALSGCATETRWQRVAPMVPSGRAFRLDEQLWEFDTASVKRDPRHGAIVIRYTDSRFRPIAWGPIVVRARWTFDCRGREFTVTDGTVFDQTGSRPLKTESRYASDGFSPPAWTAVLELARRSACRPSLIPRQPGHP